MKPLKILLVEDDELFRLGLTTRLDRETDVEITAVAEDGETAIAILGQQTFDIIVLDVGLPGMGGVEACRRIKQQKPDLAVLILTSHSQPPLIARLLEAKANGYCLKGIAAESLILAIRSLVAGASWWDPLATAEIQAAFDRCASQLSPPASANPLTNREQEILALIAAGKSNQEIATMLYIAPGTVRVHVHAILQKLDVRDRTQAAVLALQQGLVSGELLP
jgi:two-component system NarL family response regulator